VPALGETLTVNSSLSSASVLTGSTSSELAGDFPIPLFLLPIYQAAGTEYGVPWEVLAAINEVETDFGRDLSVSSAGAEGWMQFLPSTWRRYGLDADGAGSADPYDPVDAIFAAARYLHAAGASSNLREAVLAYNHSSAYANSVLSIALQLAHEPSQVLDALTGLDFGVFPVDAPSSWHDSTIGEDSTDVDTRLGAPVVASETGQVVAIGRSRALGRYVELRDRDGNTYTYARLGGVVRTYRAPGTDSATELAPAHTSTDGQFTASAGAPVAGADLLAASTHATGGYVNPLAHARVRAERIDQGVDYAGSGPLDAIGAGIVTESFAPGSGSGWPGSGGFVEYRLIAGPDAGAYIYAAEGVAPTVRVGQSVGPGQQVATIIPGSPTGIETGLASGHGVTTWAAAHGGYEEGQLTGAGQWFSELLQSIGAPAGEVQGRPVSGPSPVSFGLGAPTVFGVIPGTQASPVHTYTPTAGPPLQLARGGSARLRVGAIVQAGTRLGSVGTATAPEKPHLEFMVRALGPHINPSPVLNQWAQLPNATINAVRRPTAGQALLMDEPALEHAILIDRRIALPRCVRGLVATGQVDRRLLGALEVLADSGARPAASATACSHSLAGETWLELAGGRGATLAGVHLLQGDEVPSGTQLKHGGAVDVSYSPLFAVSNTLAGAAADVLGGAWDAAGRLPVVHVSARREPVPRTVHADVTFADAITAQPVLGMPATQIEVIGASPGEASGDAWAQGQIGPVPALVNGQQLANEQVLLRYTTSSGTWQVIPVDNSAGGRIPLTWVASEVTPNGGVALLGTNAAAQQLVTRNPGGTFAAASTPLPTVLLGGESLFSNSGPPVMASFDGGSSTGVLIAPANDSTIDPGVLLYQGGQWTREPICVSYSGGSCTAPSGLEVDAISASSSANAWLLASNGSGAPALFERELAGSSPVWVEQHPSTWLLGSGAAPGGETATVPSSGPLLTASGGGVWVDLNVSGQQPDASVYVSPGANGEVAGTWCFPASLCPGATGSLGAALPNNYGSFAWASASSNAAGARIITGLGGAALLERTDGGSSFAYKVTSGDGPSTPGGGGTFGPGGETLTSQAESVTGGAAYDAPNEGWLGTALLQSPNSPVGETPEVVHVTTAPAADQLSPFPVPFRHPLLAVAGQPGEDVGGGQSQAVAVGADGEIARYHPGTGWVPEFVYNGQGAVQTPTLRGVAWPETNYAYAVGDNGAMWMWNGQTGLWEPDPAKPLNFEGQLTAIAFDPSNPGVGYAVGKQGVLLSFGKTWTQAALPAALAQADFTSVAFAGNEAIVGYRELEPNSSDEQGGVMVNNGSGWQVDPSAQALLATLPAQDTVISKVAGLPDGGAVAAGPGIVVERDPGTSTWRFSSTPLADSSLGNIAALAAYQQGSSVRALVSVDDDPESDPSGPDDTLYQEIDNPPAVALGQPPLLVGPDPLPSHGFLERETANGWSDQEFEDYPNQSPGGSNDLDLPESPDPVLALLTDSSGQQGWAVGGQTGGAELQLNGASGAAASVQTAGLQRFGGGVTPPISNSAPMSAPSGEVTIAVGGGSGCVQMCANDVGQGVGPDNWLAGALMHASQISGLQAFLYAGQPLGSPASLLSPDNYDRELQDFDSVLGSGGSLPVYAVATSDEVNAGIGGVGGLAGTLGSHLPAGSSPPGTPAPPSGTAAYAFDSHGTGGAVRVIVLDFSAGTLSGSSNAQLNWLKAELSDATGAGIPAIVVGADPVDEPGDPNEAGDASAVSQALLGGGASAYLFYDDQEQNVATSIGHGANAVPVYGSGTLGYVAPPSNAVEADEFLGASGYLLISVNAAKRDASTNQAPVTAELIPNAGALALDAVDGTLLRRSSVSLFDGLARRPLGGEEYIGGPAGSEQEAPDPYTTLPETCLGSDCDEFIPPQYTFTSSNPEIGNFVAHDPNSTNPMQILQNSNGAAIADPNSGLFCAFNPGTTTVTISAGGLSYSQTVTVLGGSVEEPCGTVPVTVTKPPTTTPSTVPPPVVTPALVPIPPPPPPPPPPPVQTPVHTPTPATKILLSPSLPPLLFPVSATPTPPARAVFPVSPPTPRPTPPSGFTSVVTPVEVVQEEKEEEEAVETSQAFSAYHPSAPNPIVPGVVVIVLVLATAGGGARLRRRYRPGRRPALARTDWRSDQYTADARRWGRTWSSRHRR
jgi:hypothetical protein